MTRTDLHLTANEAAILKAYPTFQYASDYSLADMVDEEWGREVWTWSFTDDAAAAAGLSLRAVKGVLSSLSKKGLIVCTTDGPADERVTFITPEGMAQIVALQDPEPVVEETPEPVVEETPEPVVEDAEPITISISEYKISKHYWNSFGRMVARLVAAQVDSPVEWDATTGTASFPADNRGESATAMLAAIWTRGWSCFKTWRKSDATYKALPPQDTRWVTSERYAAEREYLVGFAYGYLGLRDAVDTHAARAGRVLGELPL